MFFPFQRKIERITFDKIKSDGLHSSKNRTKRNGWNAFEVESFRFSAVHVCLCLVIANSLKSSFCFAFLLFFSLLLGEERQGKGEHKLILHDAVVLTKNDVVFIYFFTAVLFSSEQLLRKHSCQMPAIH